METVIGAIVVAVITTIGGILTARASRRAAQRSAEVTVAGQIESSRIQAEQGAYERAREFYEGVIDRQKAEIAELVEDVHQLKSQLTAVEEELATTRKGFTAAREDLVTARDELEECRRECVACRADLADAQRILRHALHDDEEN